MTVKVTYKPDDKGDVAKLLNSVQARRALNDAGNDFIDRARVLAARERESGEYMDSFFIEQVTVKVEGEPRAAVRAGNSAPYAAFVEAGTKHRKASRILRRAAEGT